ncbi:PTS sugar transporter subunit IIA [Spiroplasma turonicum]|uniref:PTS system mannitol-specific IIA component n=1 Tax=Spiroplasma turonicum TaxID=216946 RepID=A0A0K1P822_9MOLU|nr:PTS sugar transporter subunit IIA [Spiroplasma turonicum]AKU80022.1 PTS system mannitol-specific IIA component [Spiroplasma turonicum]ALX71024.1 PTS system, mannitol-specific IIA component [Spiroplasma turonicum]
MKKERQLRILNTIINYRKVDINVLIKYFDISEKTLTRDIDDINNFIKEYGNFKLTNNEYEIKFEGITENILSKIQLDESLLLKEERLLYIFLTLLKDKLVTKSDLEDDLDVSLNQIDEDLNDLDIILKKYNLSINITKQGIKLEDILIDQEIKIIIDIITKYVLFKKVYSILKLNKIEKLFSNYVYRSLKLKYKIDIYNKIFYWLLEFTSNQVNISNLNLIIMSIKLTFWMNHPKNSILLNNIDNIEYYNEFINLIKDIYSDESYEKFFYKCLSSQKEEILTDYINLLDVKISNLFNKKLKLSLDTLERIKNHISSNIIIDNTDDFIIEEYIRNLTHYKTIYKEIWDINNDLLIEKFGEYKNIELLKYEIFIHILVWFDSYIYEKKLKILTICIGGMGQSAMIKNHLNSLYRNSIVENIPYSLVSKDYLKNFDLVISSIDLNEFDLNNFIVMPIILLLSKKNDIHKIITEKIYKKLIGENMKSEILKKENIKINQFAKDKVEAIKQCGKLLKELGYIEESYISSMLEREKKFSVYIGNYLAIPHGMNDTGVLKDGIVVIHYKDPINYDSNLVHFFIGIAAKSDNHIEILSNIAEKMMDIDFVNDLIKNPSADRILKEFNL